MRISALIATVIAGFPLLPNLTDQTGVTVREWPYKTASANQTIYLNQQLSFLEQYKFRPAFLIPIQTQAKAIYFLLHEKGHIVHGDTIIGGYNGQQDEIAANQYAAKHFKPFCTQRLHLTYIQTRKLWLSLPSYYRAPTSV